MAVWLTRFQFLYSKVTIYHPVYTSKPTIFSFQLLIPTQFLFMQLEWMLLKIDPQLEWLVFNRIFLWLLGLHYVNFSIQKYQSCNSVYNSITYNFFVWAPNSNQFFFMQLEWIFVKIDYQLLWLAFCQKSSFVFLD